MVSSLAGTEVIASMITPAVLISASGTLVFSTANRLVRVIDRVRLLAQHAEALGPAAIASRPLLLHQHQRALVADQVPRLSHRLLLLRTALTALYLAIAFFILTSIAIAVQALWTLPWPWLSLTPGFLGIISLLAASLLLIREARLAVTSSIREIDLLQKLTSVSLAHGEPEEPGGTK